MDAGVAVVVIVEAEEVGEEGLVEADQAIVRWIEEADLAAEAVAGAVMAAVGVEDAIAGGASVAAGVVTIFAVAVSRTTSPAGTCAKYAGTPSNLLHSERTFTFPTTMLRGGPRLRLNLTEAKIKSQSKVAKCRRQAFTLRRADFLIML